MAERDERALREALQALGPDEPVDSEAARRRAAERRRNGRALAGVAVALVLVAGVVGLPRVLPAQYAQPTAAEQGEAAPAERRNAGAGGSAEDSASKESAPDGWRTEYYLDISFQVPDSWGYAVPPQSDWCIHEPKGQPRADHLQPYVWLGGRIAVRTIKCPARPTSLLTEHVEALAPGPATDYVEGAIKEGDWWVVTRFAGSAVLVVTTKDRTLAERILDSAAPAPREAPCPPSSPIAGPLGVRPQHGMDPRTLPEVDWVVLCQYEPVADPADVKLPRLRAVARLTGSAARALVSDLATAPVNDSSCDSAPVDNLPELAVLARVRAGDRTYDIDIAATGCPEGAGMVGGIDDGRTVRLLTRNVCQRVLTQPIGLWSGSGDVGRNCLG